MKSRSAQRTAYAGRAVQILYAFLLMDGRRPSLLLALEGTVWRFDAEGRVDYSVPTFDESRIGLTTPFVADVLPLEATQTGDRWQPTDRVRRAVEQAVWPAGLPSIEAVSSDADLEDCASLKRALVAVGTAGIARTMSRLVGELSLSQQTTERLMSALSVEPEILLDMIAAERQFDDSLMH
ncbi:MAG: hypothetical protein ACFCVH_07765 [Alphaproteobacteria bacterium]